MAEPWDTIERVANGLGVDPALAKAIAQKESGGSVTAIGDNGCSFGLFQLNICGGEGAGHAGPDLFNPVLNATIALTKVAQVQQTNYPGKGTPQAPGLLAALAQRPANPSRYAIDINNILARGASGLSQIPQGSAGQQTQSIPKASGGGILGAIDPVQVLTGGTAGGITSGELGQIGGAAAQAAGTPCAPWDLNCQLKRLQGTIWKAAFLFAGAGMMVIGVIMFAMGHKDVRIAVEQTAQKAAAVA